MLASVFIALALGFVFMIFLRFCSGVVVWTFVLSIFVLLIACTALCGSKYAGYNIDWKK